MCCGHRILRIAVAPQQPPAARAFYAASMTAALAVGALQMFHVRGGFVTDYGADLAGTAWIYAMFRQGRTVFQRGRGMTPWATAAFVFLGCAASEAGQKIHLVPGRFDALDLAAYAVSVSACYALDRWFIAPTLPGRAETPAAASDTASRKSVDYAARTKRFRQPPSQKPVGPGGHEED